MTIFILPSVPFRPRPASISLRLRLMVNPHSCIHASESMDAAEPRRIDAAVWISLRLNFVELPLFLNGQKKMQRRMAL